MLTILAGNSIQFRKTGEAFFKDQAQRSDFVWPDCYMQPIDKRFSSGIQIGWTYERPAWLIVRNNKTLSEIAQIPFTGSLGLFTTEINWSAYSEKEFQLLIVEQVSLDGGSLQTFIVRATSEPLKVQKCILLQYWNNVETDVWGNFDAFKYKLHLPGIIYESDFPDDTVDFIDSKGDLYNLDAEMYEEFTLKVDQAPHYLHKIISTALLFHNIEFAGEQYVRNGSYNKESESHIPLGKASVTLRKVGAALSNVWRAFEPINLGNPIQHLFSTLLEDEAKPKIAIDGTVYDYSGDRDGTVYPSQAYKGDTLTYILVHGTFSGNNTVSYYDAVSETWKTVTGTQTATMQDGEPGIEFQIPNDEIAWNVKGWNPGYTPTSADQESIEYNTNIAFWFSGEEGAANTLYDMAGNFLHGTAWTPQADFHVFDGDGFGSVFTVKHSFVNTHGFNLTGSAKIPVNMADKDFAATGVALVNKGRVNYNGKVKNNPCIILAKDEILLYPSYSIILDLTPINSVVCDGTATLTIDKTNRRLIAKAGTCWNIRHLDIDGNVLGHNPVSEGVGARLCDVTSTTNNAYDLGVGVLDTIFNWSTQNEYAYNQSVGANNYLVLYEQENTPVVDAYFSNLASRGFSAGDRTFTTSTGTVGGRDNVQIVTLTPAATIEDWRMEALNYFSMLGLNRFTAGFNVRISFDYYATGDIASLSAIMGQNRFVANSLGSFVPNAWTPFLVEEEMRGSGYFIIGTSNLIGFWIQNTIKAGQIAFDNFNIEIISAIPALSAGVEDVLGKPLDPDFSKKLFDSGESLVINDKKAPDLLTAGRDDSEVAFSGIVEQSVNTQWSRWEPRTSPVKKSDILTNLNTPTFAQQNSIKKFLNIE